MHTRRATPRELQQRAAFRHVDFGGASIIWRANSYGARGHRPMRRHRAEARRRSHPPSLVGQDSRGKPTEDKPSAMRCVVVSSAGQTGVGAAGDGATHVSGRLGQPHIRSRDQCQSIRQEQQRECRPSPISMTREQTASAGQTGAVSLGRWESKASVAHEKALSVRWPFEA